MKQGSGQCLLLKARIRNEKGFHTHDVSIGGMRLKIEPLFSSEQGTGLQIDAATGTQWLLANVEGGGSADSPWDLAHTVAANGAASGFAEPNAEMYVEPDLLQRNCYEYSHGSIPDAAFAADVCTFHPQDAKHWPEIDGFAWHLGTNFSQLKEARELVGDISHGQPRIRIAILDTGYDENHYARPDHILTHLERSFISDENPLRALDPGVKGGSCNPGHGTGTISILAGRRVDGMRRPEQNTKDFLGGAPFAEILPIRIADSVVHFYSSTMARGLEYVLAPGGDANERSDVVSISMGGLPSRPWAELVNRCYEAGIILVAAAGNNVGAHVAGVELRSPSTIVWPARFRRVIAATGITGGLTPYHTSEQADVLQGNFGPASKMSTALAAYTPNIPWAKLGCHDLIDHNGAGTSSATPQVAAAAALWLQKHRPDFPSEPWKRVEAARAALFESAKRDGLADVERFFGRGALRAKDALNREVGNLLSRTPSDTVSFPLIRILTGIPLAPRERLAMFELEALQLTQRIPELCQMLGDPDDPQSVGKESLREFIDTVIEREETSEALRKFFKEYRGYTLPSPATRKKLSHSAALQEEQKKRQITSRPPVRRLRGYAFDPSLSTQLDLAVINHTTYSVQWEERLAAGPIGEYVEVVDYDPASNCYYDPVDLNDPYMLAQDGLSPSEGNPQFHQQMVYAVAMTTIRNFERALGRRVLWAPRRIQASDGSIQDEYVPRLRIYPHALREANAYYSPQKKALLFGYFPADASDPGRHYPGGTVFTCLSHDVIAHETTHAILDGLHQRFVEVSNPDVPAFHEAFADIVALFQHFTYPEVLRHQLAQTRGDLRKQNILGQLAQQFGRAIGHYGALRDAIGHIDRQTKQWEPTQPDPRDYQRVFEPHRRGAILVATVFDAFLSIYKTRVTDLLRIASNGTGVLPTGEIHPDLVNRLSQEAAKSARHILRMCIRALDYCPTVDVTFGDYLRALITADYDLIPEDRLGYRVALVEAFRRRGIYPRDLRTLSVDTLRWEPITYPSARMRGISKLLRAFLQAYRYCGGRRKVYKLMERYRARLHNHLRSTEPGLAMQFGLDPTVEFEVHSLRPAQRVSPDGDSLPQIIIEITQKRPVEMHEGNGLEPHPIMFRGGCTLIVDVNGGIVFEEDEDSAIEELEVRYCIQKNIFATGRLCRQMEYIRHGLHSGLWSTYYGESTPEPFAVLHREFEPEEP